MPAPSDRADRVAATGAVVALVGCLVPAFVTLRPNRIVPGSPSGLIPVAGPFGWLLLATTVGAVAASVAPRVPRRGMLLRVLGAAQLVALAWALGASAERLLSGAGAYARVSVGAGAWLVAVGALVVAFASRRRAEQVPASWALSVDVLTVLGVAAAVVWGGVRDLSLAREYAAQSQSFWTDVGEHVALSAAGVFFGAVIGIPLGVFAYRNGTVRRIALGVVGVIQTVPSLALLGLLIAPLAALRVASPLLASLGVSGIGTVPAVIALTLYALLPIVRNTYVGLAGVDPAAVDAGRGMGMSRGQLLLRVQLPLALPLVLEGLRSATVLVIGITTVTAFIGAGGLGVLIVTGLGQVAEDLVLLGAIPVIVLAVLADLGMRGVSRVVVSRGIREAV